MVVFASEDPRRGKGGGQKQMQSIAAIAGLSVYCIKTIDLSL